VLAAFDDRDETRLAHALILDHRLRVHTEQGPPATSDAVSSEAEECLVVVLEHPALGMRWTVAAAEPHQQVVLDELTAAVERGLLTAAGRPETRARLRALGKGLRLQATAAAEREALANTLDKAKDWLQRDIMAARARQAGQGRVGSSRNVLGATAPMPDGPEAEALRKHLEELAAVRDAAVRFASAAEGATAAALAASIRVLLDTAGGDGGGAQAGGAPAQERESATKGHLDGENRLLRRKVHELEQQIVEHEREKRGIRDKVILMQGEFRAEVAQIESQFASQYREREQQLRVALSSERRSSVSGSTPPPGYLATAHGLHAQQPAPRTPY
jgi:hypothetical protein